jgi:hypothetical protein
MCCFFGGDLDEKEDWIISAANAKWPIEVEASTMAAALINLYVF